MKAIVFTTLFCVALGFAVKTAKQTGEGIGQKNAQQQAYAMLLNPEKK